MYTVKQVADLAEVSVRTLHHYDDIGLLQPSKVGSNRYRYYDDDALLRLQQILFYREMGLELMQIKEILDSPDFDTTAALHAHRAVLEKKINRLHNLIQTVDDTIKHIGGEQTMSKKQLFGAFSEEEQKDYQRLARLQYGPDLVNESVRRWSGYSKAEQNAIFAEANEIYGKLVEAIEADKSPHDADVQATLQDWHNNIRHFYEPTLEIMRGLAYGYNSHPGFIANFQKLHPDLPQYLEDSITQYVDDLEYAEIERMLAADGESVLGE